MLIPASFSPRQVVEGWLPDAWRAAPPEDDLRLPRLRLTLSGVNGGDWLLDADGSELRIEAVPPAARPGPTGVDVWVRLSAQDFAAVVHGDPDLPALLPPGDTPLAWLVRARSEGDLLRGLAGRAAFEITGRKRRRWMVDTAFGPTGMNAGRPRTIIRTEGVAFERLRTGAQAPLQALLDGSVKVEGDRQLAMQMFMLAAARLTPRR